MKSPSVKIKPTREERRAAETAAKDAVFAVSELAAKLPPAVTAAIYAAVVGDLGRRAGLTPRAALPAKKEDPC